MIKRSFFLVLIICFAIDHSFAQLESNSPSINIGEIDGRQVSTIYIPILNQSRDTLYFSSLNSEKDQGNMSLPGDIQSYQEEVISKSIHYYSNQKHFSSQIVFKNNEGKISIRIKGKITNAGGNQDCYDFNKTNSKVKTSGKFITSSKEADLIRIYDAKDRNTLYASDPLKIPYAHLVILVDASGSMGRNEKLNQIKDHLFGFIDEMRPTDYISIINYNQGAEILADKISCSEKQMLKNIIEEIEAGGFTNGKDGIVAAMNHSKNRQEKGYSNQIIMFTDGEFNLGDEQEGIRRFLLGESRSYSYKLSIMTIGSSRQYEKEMKELSENGNGYYFNLDDKLEDRMERNKILIKQLSI